MVDGTGNATRHLVMPLDALRRLESIDGRNSAYAAHAVRLGEAAARRAVDAAGIAPDAIGTVIGVSSTGYLLPTLETHVIERLGLSPTCRRVPLTQLGCAGGAAGLGLANALSATAPVLVVSVELPSLSFPNLEPSVVDVIAATQFGDGAAAVLAGGGRGRGPEILAAGSMVFRDTIDRDGARVTAAGFRLQRPRGLAGILRSRLGAAVDGFLAEHRLTRRDIGFWVVHPRNPDLLDAAADGLGLPPGAVAASRTIWTRHGNLASAAVFHVLDELAATQPPVPGGLGLLIAYGAGFACEMVLLRAGGWLCGARAATASPAAQIGAA